jgi:hypothetical protein
MPLDLADRLLFVPMRLDEGCVEKLNQRNSKPSSQNISSSVSLPWSCQAIDGVMTKSPGDI